MEKRRPSREEQRRLVAGWRETGLALERLRRADLRGLSAAQAREAAYDLLQLGGMLPPDLKRERSSGLVEMQRLFARGHGVRRA